MSKTKCETICSVSEILQIKSSLDISFRSEVINGKVTLRTIEVAALSKAAFELISALKEKKDIESRHKLVLNAIERATQRIIGELINLRLNELRGRVEGLLNEFRSFPVFNQIRLSYFISESNRLEGELRVLMEEKGRPVWDRLAPSYITVILLRATALIKNDEDAIWSFKQAKILLDRVRADLEGTVRCYRYFDADLAKSAIWCRSDYTGLSVDQLDSEQLGVRWVLSTSSYADILETLESIDGSIVGQ